MPRAFILALALLAATVSQAGQKPALKPAVVPNTQPTPKLRQASLSRHSEDASAENRILELANQSRAEAGVAALRENPSLLDAAREHATQMMENGQLSHQFPGEAPLLRRVAQVTTDPIDRAGENVAFSASPDRAHNALMQSPPHRANLLDPRFNVVGIAAVWSGGRLYVVEDFGHETPSYSPSQTQKLVERAIEQRREQAGLPPLSQISKPGLSDSVCELAENDQMQARAIPGSETSRSVVAYRQNDPTVLPEAARQRIADRALTRFSLGTCLSRNDKAPAGMYWVAILLY